MHAVLMRQSRLHRQKEYFWVMGLNTAHDIMYIELVTIGTLNKNNVDPVEIFSFAVQKKCKRVIDHLVITENGYRSLNVV